MHHTVIIDRILSRVEITAGPLNTPCWLWQGSRMESGYGQVRDPVLKKCVLAHRVIYEWAIGEIPGGHILHHWYEQPACVNPGHVTPMLRSEHRQLHGIVGGEWQRRKTHCPQGHSYSGDNLGITPSGWRRCRECKRLYMQRQRDAAEA